MAKKQPNIMQKFSNMKQIVERTGKPIRKKDYKAFISGMVRSAILEQINEHETTSLKNDIISLLNEIESLQFTVGLLIDRVKTLEQEKNQPL